MMLLWTTGMAARFFPGALSRQLHAPFPLRPQKCPTSQSPVVAPTGNGETASAALAAAMLSMDPAMSRASAADCQRHQLPSPGSAACASGSPVTAARRHWPCPRALGECSRRPGPTRRGQHRRQRLARLPASPGPPRELLGHLISRTCSFRVVSVEHLFRPIVGEAPKPLRSCGW